MFFNDFAVFDRSVAVNSVYKLQLFTFILARKCIKLAKTFAGNKKLHRYAILIFTEYVVNVYFVDVVLVFCLSIICIFNLVKFVTKLLSEF